MQTKIHIKPVTYIYLVILLFILPLKWLLAWVFAAAFHEASHWIAVKVCGGEIYYITIGIGGAKMECGPMTKKKGILAVLCGPFGGLLLVFFARWIPRIALCSWFLSCYNLLPLQSLDGGRALEIMLGKRAFAIQKVFVMLLAIGAFYASMCLRCGFLPVVVVSALWLKNRNNPCKPDCCKVQ